MNKPNGSSLKGVSQDKSHGPLGGPQRTNGSTGSQNSYYKSIILDVITF